MRGRQDMSRGTRLLTAEEFEHVARDHTPYALVDGVPVAMVPVSFAHGRVAVRIGSMLLAHVDASGLGSEAGFVLSTGPDTVRAPDVAFVAAARAASAEARGLFAGPPDLAVEVLSPEDRGTGINAKVADYLRYGTAVVLVVDSERQTASVHRCLAPPIVASTPDDVIDLDDVVPGFRVSSRRAPIAPSRKEHQSTGSFSQ